jgi:hypothetical protein
MLSTCTIAGDGINPRFEIVYISPTQEHTLLQLSETRVAKLAGRDGAISQDISEIGTPPRN